MNSKAQFQKTYLLWRMEQNDSSAHHRQSCKSELLECSVKETLKHNCRTTKYGIENVWYQEFSD